MPEHIKRGVFHYILDDDDDDPYDVEVAYNYISFHKKFDNGEFVGHENDWVLMCDQEVKEIRPTEYSDDELNRILEEHPAAVPVPVDESKYLSGRRTR